jgi:hypothetical protein
MLSGKLRKGVAQMSEYDADRFRKMDTEYLERAITLERLAADEQDSKFKTELLNQAAAYRKLAARRAEQHGLPPPSPPEPTN